MSCQILILVIKIKNVYMPVIMNAIATDGFRKSFVFYIGVYGVQYSDYLTLER
jgi:hypothetical protein